MSRSYKKTPVIKDSDNTKWVKRQATKSVRRYKGILAKGSSYKKLFESWNICDYRFYEPWDIDNQIFYENDKKEWSKYYLWK